MFPFFFQDKHCNYKSEDCFFNFIVQRLQINYFLRGEGIQKTNSSFNSLYFVKQGNVELLDENCQHLCNLSEGAVFGDYEIFLGLKSSINYVSDKNTTFMCIYTLQREEFVQSIEMDGMAIFYLIKNALKKREFHENLVKSVPKISNPFHSYNKFDKLSKFAHS